MNVRRKSILFLLLISFAGIAKTHGKSEQASLISRLKDDLYKIVTLPLLPLCIKISRKKYKQYEAPEHIQKKAKEYFDYITRNENILKRPISWFKKKFKYYTVYQGAQTREGCTAFYLPWRGGVHFADKEIIKTNTLYHELEHVDQDKIIFHNLFWPKYRSEYNAEKQRTKHLFENNPTQKEVEQELKEAAKRAIFIIENPGNLHHYIFGGIDGLLELGYKKELFEQASEIIEKSVRSHKKSILEMEVKQSIKRCPNLNEKMLQELIDKIGEEKILNRIIKNAKQGLANFINNQLPAKNWRERRRQYKKEFPTVWNPDVPVIEG